MDSLSSDITVEQIDDFLARKRMKIIRLDILDNSEMLQIRYIIKSINDSRLDDTNEKGSITIFIYKKGGYEEFIPHLSKSQRTLFRERRSMTTEKPLYCYISWVNGSQKYKNMGKLLILYVMLKLSEMTDLFIIKLDNASDNLDTYKILGFEPVMSDYGRDEREIMISTALPQVKRDLVRLLRFR